MLTPFGAVILVLVEVAPLVTCFILTISKRKTVADTLETPLVNPVTTSPSSSQEIHTN